MTRQLAVLLTLAAMLLVSGCGPVTIGSLPGKEALPGKDSIMPQPDAIDADSDPLQVLDAAYKRLCEVKSYRTKTEMTGPTGASIMTTAEFVVPDRRRTVQFAGTNAEFETITIGSRTYSRSQGRWTEMTGPLSNAYANPGFMCSDEPPPPLPADLPKIVRKFIGTGEVNGKKVMMFSSEIAVDGRSDGGTMTGTISVGARDGLLYRTESTSTSKELGKIATVTTYSDYDADIRIESPI